MWYIYIYWICIEYIYWMYVAYSFPSSLFIQSQFSLLHPTLWNRIIILSSIPLLSCWDTQSQYWHGNQSIWKRVSRFWICYYYYYHHPPIRYKQLVCPNLCGQSFPFLDMDTWMSSPQNQMRVFGYLSISISIIYHEPHLRSIPHEC